MSWASKSACSLLSLASTGVVVETDTFPLVSMVDDEAAACSAAAALVAMGFPVYLLKQTGERCPSFLQCPHMSFSCFPSFFV